jgi:hypothetical protein
MKFQFIQFYPDDFTSQFRRLSIRRKQGHLPPSLFGALKHINGFAPGRMLAVVYFAKIEHLSLNNPVARHSLVLNDTPVAMFFAVLKAVFGSEKHAPIFQDKIKKSRG